MLGVYPKPLGDSVNDSASEKGLGVFVGQCDFVASVNCGDL